MAYTKTNWVNNTTPLNATNMNKIEEGIAAVDKAVEAVKNGYLPLSGGTLTGMVYINENFFAKKDVNIDGFLTCHKIVSKDGIQCNGISVSGGISIGDVLDARIFYGENISLNAMDSSEHLDINTNSISYENVDNPASWTFTGISDSTGTSSTVAVSQKCLNDNYMPKAGGVAFSNPIAINGNLDMYGTISFPDAPYSNKLTAIVDDKGTSSTTAVSQKCLNDNYIPFDNIPTLKRHLDIPIGTYSVIFTNSTGNGNSVSINGNRIDVSDNTNEQTLTINQSNISYGNSNGESWTFSGISDSKGTSSTVAVSQKCLSDNYIAKTSAAVSAAINLLPAGTSAPVDADYYVCQSVGGGTTDTTYYRRPMSYLWSYINGKVGSSYLPLSGGTLTGALTATKFTGDGSGLTSIPAGNLTGTINAARLPDLSGKYLPISGGTLTGSLEAVGSISVSGNLSVNISDGAGVSVSDGQNAVLLSQAGLEDPTGTWAFTGISDAKGTSSTLAVSQKCLNDNYLALSGGTITGDTTVMGSTGQYGIKFTNGDIQFLSDGGATVGGTITGISSSKGTSTTRAMSEKGVADNYLAKSDISNTTGTDTTKVPSLKCLNDNYLPLSGGSVNGTLNAESLNVNETALLLGGANIQSNTDIYGHLKIKTDDGTEYLTLSQNSIQYSNTNTNINWTFAGTVFSTTDLTAGTSALPDNQLYFVYE